MLNTTSRSLFYLNHWLRSIEEYCCRYKKCQYADDLKDYLGEIMEIVDGIKTIVDLRLKYEASQFDALENVWPFSPEKIKTYHYDVGNAQSIYDLKIHKFKKNGSGLTWLKSYRSLNECMNQVDSYYRELNELNKIKSKIELHQNSHYYEQYEDGISQTLSHLYNIIKIHNDHPGSDLLCFPEGPYYRSTSSVEALLTLKPKLFKQNYGFVTSHSLQAYLDALDRQRNYFNIKEEIVNASIVFAEKDNAYTKQVIDELYRALSRLFAAIEIFNNGLVPKTDREGTLNDVLHKCHFSAHDLSSKRAMLAAAIATFGDDDALFSNLSIEILLEKLRMPRLTKYLYNMINGVVMRVIYGLQKSAAGQPIKSFEQAVSHHAKHIANTLNHLYLAIQQHYVEPAIIQEETSQYDFSSIDGLLNAKVYTTCHEGEEKKHSLITALLQSYEDISEPNYSEVEKKFELLKKHVVTESDLKKPVIMHDTAFNSIIKAKAICHLAEIGDLDQIKDLKPSVAEINLILDQSIGETVLSAIHNPYYLSRVIHKPIIYYLVNYNALMVAASYRHLHVVAYFMQLGADPSIKGGNRFHMSAYDCSKLNAPFLGFTEPDPAINALLSNASASVQSDSMQGGSLCDFQLSV